MPNEGTFISHVMSQSLLSSVWLNKSSVVICPNDWSKLKKFKKNTFQPWHDISTSFWHSSKTHFLGLRFCQKTYFWKKLNSKIKSTETVGKLRGKEWQWDGPKLFIWHTRKIRQKLLRYLQEFVLVCMRSLVEFKWWSLSTMEIISIFLLWGGKAPTIIFLW